MPTADQRRAAMARLRATRRAAEQCAQCGAPSKPFRCDECALDLKFSRADPTPDDLAAQRDRMRRLRSERRAA